MLRTFLISQIEEKLWAQRRLSNNDEAPKPSSLQFTPLSGNEPVPVPKLSLDELEKVQTKLCSAHLASDEESEIKVENHAHAAGCQYA